MCYVFYAIALILGVLGPAFIASSMQGLHIGVFWDLISFLMTVGASFFLVATTSGTLSFYKDDKFLEMWGDVALKIGYIGVAIGLISMLAGMAQPPMEGVDPAAKLGGSFAICLIVLLYALLFKYFVIEPWLGCRKK
jgi:flagellar motor component MotA